MIKGYFIKRAKAQAQIRKLESQQHRAVREVALSGDEKSKEILQSIEKGILQLREYIKSLSTVKVVEKIDATVLTAKSQIDEIGKP
jgi:Spy/CpxP family protein refolding chaperone